MLNFQDTDPSSSTKRQLSALLVHCARAERSELLHFWTEAESALAHPRRHLGGARPSQLALLQRLAMEDEQETMASASADDDDVMLSFEPPKTKT